MRWQFVWLRTAMIMWPLAVFVFRDPSHDEKYVLAAILWAGVYWMGCDLDKKSLGR
jgi:hypothetical protein